MKTVRLTTAQALVKFLSAQLIEVEGEKVNLFGCAFAIFGHGNVTCLGQELFENQDKIQTWRGQNEQSMAHAAIAYAKANKRKRIGIATSSVGPGATNMVTAAGVAHTNRLPLLLLAGDTFQSRLPDPVLQQTEHFNDPTITANDSFKSVTRFWDRITKPSQLVSSLPNAIASLLDPGDCGPALIALPQDVQGEAWDYPVDFFKPRLHRIRRPQPEHVDIMDAATVIRQSEKPMIIVGGGVIYSDAEEIVESFSDATGIPMVETIAGRSALLASHPNNCGPIGTTGSDSANNLAKEADVVIAIGTRLQDFTTGSWTVFQNPDLRLISINTCRHDAIKSNSLAIIADARDAVSQLSSVIGPSKVSEEWVKYAQAERASWFDVVAKRVAKTSTSCPSYAHVIGEVNRLAEDGDRIITAAGGLPAELNMNWLARHRAEIDIEFGFSCMGYEVAAGWGVKIANPDHDPIVLVGDGSYLMLNSDIYSSVLTGHKIIVLVCDNGGFAVINKLQNNTGNSSFNNLLKDCSTQLKTHVPRVDFTQHAESLGANSEKLTNLDDFENAFSRAKESDKTYVIVIDIEPTQWSSTNAWWEVGLPEVTSDETRAKVIADWELGRKNQRKGV
ncbi:3D-(3,5/4)-trihydroxycyclohexane-1,2-dione hydrolase [Vibrio thalassae]|uniref:3D-(3,5/4)-trihydroxycyclohexane-1,2-dione hydrolase n=1 Tax=Vibrio thalassae TaxID=1243014 RepID=A0A240EMK8_9VIBR|nr:3D-(3,5/4)-trihydroxycyclohexane-1,2-dione acylhydrolase (decyclizing) [Vibrio thalassae]SNX49503.1 3D-(3,5/4)-trihydroxycyclohexane-1,2-dione hydrolase [Vibrio thalassae]